MGDSWDETSVEVSEADISSFAKNVDSDDLDKDLFGGLSRTTGSSKPSLLQAMKKSTGKTMFDDDDRKPTAAKPKQFSSPKPEMKKPVMQSTPKPKAKASSDDDLLADLLGDSDYSEISQAKPLPKLPAKPAKQSSVAPTAKTTPKTQAPASKTLASRPKKDNLFDDDEDDLLGMLDSEHDDKKPSKQLPAKGNTTPVKKPDSASKPKSKFDEILNRTSLMKETPPRDVSTPIKRGPKNDDLENIGFTPSPGGTGRSRRGLSSGVSTPKSVGGLQPDDTFSALMKEDKDLNADIFAGARTPEVKPSTPGKPSNIEDMFRVDRQSTPAGSRHGTPAKPPPEDDIFSVARSNVPDTKASSVEDMFRVDRQSTPGGPRGRSQTPVNTTNNFSDVRPHTHAGNTGENDTFTQSRPPSAGRRATTAIPSRTGGETPQRRRSEDSLFADEDIPNKTMPWEENAAPSALPWDNPPATPANRTPGPGTPANRTPGPGTPVNQPPGTPAVRTPLPWDNKSSDNPQSGAVGGTATEMILQQNTALEKKISELEAEKDKLEKNLYDSKTKQTETSKTLNKDLEELRSKVESLETKLQEKEKELSSAESRLEETKANLETIEKRAEQKYRDSTASLEKHHQDRISGLNALLEEKERIIQNEIKSASQRLKHKEELLLEENQTQLRQWKLRMEETEQRYETKLRDVTSSHDRDMENLKLKHERELEEQQRLRKEELCAVLSVQQTTTALKELTEKVNLSADEIGTLTAKLDINRTVTIEEREKAAKVMSEYLHDLKRSLDKQEMEISDERARLQDVVGKMESHLREQTRLSNAAQDKLIADEARFRSLKASWEADKVEEERKLEKVREQLERSKNSLLSEQRDHMELLYKERKEIAREKTRLATASQKATQKVAEGAVKQLDIEAQAQAIFDQTKRKASQMNVEKEKLDNEKKTYFRNREELDAEKARLAKLAEKLSARVSETEQYGEALNKARSECCVVQQQLAKLETELRMREDEIKIREKTLKDSASSIAAERDLLKLDRQSLNAEGVQCPACNMYRPRTRARQTSGSPIRSSSPIRQNQISPIPGGGHSPLSPLNLSLLSTGSFIGSRYKYPSASVLELTGSLQRFSALSELDRHALQVQKDKLSRFKDMDRKLLDPSYS
ncbi:hypothetical protein ACHWQZ_G009928 [Mnemiopsis leidyi]